MRKIIRLILALILGVVAFELVSVRPLSPILWEQQLNIAPGSCLGGFHSDGKSIYSYEWRINQGTDLPLEIVKRDTESGLELSRALVPGGTTIPIFVDDSKIIIITARRQFSVFDAKSGERLLGPINCTGHFSDTMGMPTILVSSDGQWIIFHFREASVVFSTTTGERVAVVEIEDPIDHPEASAFAPDGKSVAVLNYIPSGGGRVRIIDLPSGRISKRFTVPNQMHGQGFAWDGRYCTIVSYAIDNSYQRYRKRTLVYDTFEEPVAEPKEDPLQSYEINREDHTVCLEGKGWIAHYRHRELEKPWWYPIATWIDNHAGSTWSKNLPERTLTVFDKSTGTWQKPISMAGAEMWMLSPDGHRLAVYSSNHGPNLKVIATYASLRWPWACAGALLAFVLVYFLPSLPRRSKAAPAVPS